MANVSGMGFNCQQKKDSKEFKRLVNLFKSKPFMFVDGSCLFTTSDDMEGVDYIIATPKGIVTGVAKYADMGGKATRKHLEAVYNQLCA